MPIKKVLITGVYGLIGGESLFVFAGAATTLSGLWLGAATSSFRPLFAVQELAYL